MKRTIAVLCAAVLVLAGCVHRLPSAGWVTLIDGDKGLENFDHIGGANWRAEGGAIVADKGKPGFLVSKASYKDVHVYAEFWADTSTNSGLFVRATDPKNVTGINAYEANIYDLAPNAQYGTGSIVNYASAPVPNPYKVGGRWNTYEVHVKGTHVSVKLNGQLTTYLINDANPAGRIALQFANGPKGAPGGPIKWRRLEVRPL